MILRGLLTASFSMLLIGCGGGGGGSSAPTSVQQTNRAPTSISLANNTVLEGTKGSTVGTLSTSDPDGGSFSYTITKFITNTNFDENLFKFNTEEYPDLEIIDLR